MLSMLCKNLKRIIKRTSKLLTLDFNKYNILKPKRKLRFGFTMAEAVLVMTILGIIATIMITTLKPAEFKDKGLRVLADKVMGEIDNATTQILLNDSRDGTMWNLIAVDGTYFGHEAGDTTMSNAPRIGALYKKYLATTRKECNDDNCPCWKISTNKDRASYFYLKDGACMTLILATAKYSTENDYVFPGEDYDTVKDLKPKNRIGTIYFDINGNGEPNTMGKDQFRIPLGEHGIIYDEE